MRTAALWIAASVTATAVGCADMAEVELPNHAVTKAIGWEKEPWTRGGARNAWSRRALIGVSMSGGGMRATTFGLGVLKGMDEATREDSKETLADEIDVITGVSGGSVAAAYYAMTGPKGIEELREKWTKRNVQGELLQKLAAPTNMARMTTEGVTRTVIFEEYLEEKLFGRTTYQELNEGSDLSRRSPYLVIGAADLSEEKVINFTQKDFNELCSWLGSLTVAKAVAASTAYPGVMEPVRIGAYPGYCAQGKHGGESAIEEVINAEIRNTKAELQGMRKVILEQEKTKRELEERRANLEGQRQAYRRSKEAAERTLEEAEEEWKETVKRVEEHRERARGINDATEEAKQKYDSARENLATATDDVAVAEERVANARRDRVEAEERFKSQEKKKEEEEKGKTKWERVFGGRSELDTRMRASRREVADKTAVEESATRQLKWAKQVRVQAQDEATTLKLQMETKVDEAEDTQKGLRELYTIRNRVSRQRGIEENNLRNTKTKLQELADESRKVTGQKTELHVKMERTAEAHGELEKKLAELENLQRARTAVGRPASSQIPPETGTPGVSARHLMDGGLLDNTGLSGVIEILSFIAETTEIPELNEYRERLPEETLVVVVDAGREGTEGRWDKLTRPGTFRSAWDALTTALRARTDSRLEQARELAEALSEAGIRTTIPILSLADVVRSSGGSRKCWEWFNRIDTNWALSEEEEQALIDLGRALLAENTEYGEFARRNGWVIQAQPTVNEICTSVVKRS